MWNVVLGSVDAVSKGHTTPSPLALSKRNLCGRRLLLVPRPIASLYLKSWRAIFCAEDEI